MDVEDTTTTNTGTNAGTNTGTAADGFMVIPAGTARRSCKLCGQWIYFVRIADRRRLHPVSVAHENALPPTVIHDGRGVSHLANCHGAPKR